MKVYNEKGEFIGITGAPMCWFGTTRTLLRGIEEEEYYSNKVENNKENNKNE